MNKQERIANTVKSMRTNEKVGVFNLFHAMREERNLGIYSIDAFNEIIRKMFEDYSMVRIVIDVRSWSYINLEDPYFMIQGSSSSVSTMAEEDVNKYINDVAAELIAEYCIENNDYLGNEAIRKVMHRMTDEEIEEAVESWLQDMEDYEYLQFYNSTHCDEIHEKCDVDRELRYYFDDMSFSEVVDDVANWSDDYYDAEYFVENSCGIKWFSGFDDVKDYTLEDLKENILRDSDYWYHLPYELKEAMEYYGDEE